MNPTRYFLLLAPPNGGGPCRRWTPPAVPIEVARARYIPPPCALLLHTLEGLLRSPHDPLANVPPTRRALLLDAAGAYDSLRAECAAPLLDGRPDDFSPLLFPHTSDNAAAAIAAIHYNIQGPALSLQTDAFGDLLDEARLLFEEDLADAVVLAAIHFPDLDHKPETLREIATQTGKPFMDCGVAALLLPGDLDSPPPNLDPPFAFRNVHLGSCAAFFEALFHD